MSRSMLIHDLVVATFSELGTPAPIDVCETLFVKDGCFIGHKFHCNGGYAMWGLGSKAVEFYDDDGKLLKMVNVNKASEAKPALVA
jgi:hypothetical protein